MALCSTKSHDGRHMHEKNNRSAQYNMQCCSENMCNENVTFPDLPPVPVLSTKGMYNRLALTDCCSIEIHFDFFLFFVAWMVKFNNSCRYFIVMNH